MISGSLQDQRYDWRVGGKGGGRVREGRVEGLGERGAGERDYGIWNMIGLPPLLQCRGSQLLFSRASLVILFLSRAFTSRAVTASSLIWHRTSQAFSILSSGETMLLLTSYMGKKTVSFLDQ